MQAVKSVNKETIKQFAKQHIDPSSTINTDTFLCQCWIASVATHIPRVALAILVDEWLLWVHVAIANLKRFLLGTFYEISKNYVQP